MTSTRTRVPRMTEEIFWSRVVKGPGCWVYTGPIDDRTGYGKVGRWGSAHVVAWTLTYGPVPKGKQLDHVRERGCVTRACCRPSHLEPVTIRENLLRSSLTLAGRNARKTCCPQGHPYTPANTEHTPQGRRKCRTCRAEQSRRAYAALKARRNPDND